MSRTELFEDSDAHGGIGTYTVIEVIRSKRKVVIKPRGVHFWCKKIVLHPPKKPVLSKNKV